MQVFQGVSTAVVVHSQYGYTFWTMPAANLPLQASTQDSWTSPETAVAVLMPVVTPASFLFTIVLGMLLLLCFGKFVHQTHHTAQWETNCHVVKC